MNVFKKLVQNKRKNMLILALLLFAFHSTALFQGTSGISLVNYIKKFPKRGLVEPHCIAEDNERYAAVGWIYPMPETDPDIKYKFIPHLENDYNCNFSKNHLCNTRWSIKNWKIDDSSSKTFNFISDSRWEELPTIKVTNASGDEFKERFEVPNSFNLGFSVRAAHSAEILTCTGWNPYDYSCYSIKINKNMIDLYKLDKVPKNESEYGNSLDSSQTFTNILSPDEWRNFIFTISANGSIILTDVNVNNRNLIDYSDKDLLKPLYFFMRSKETSVWKVHQNHFMYTKTAQGSRLGPQLTVKSKNLCVFLYYSTCANCEMVFFRTNGTKVILQTAPSTNGNWEFIKIKEENLNLDKVNLFVETKFTDGSNQTEGFWAIDDVRVCHESEVKLSFIPVAQSKSFTLPQNITCQLIKKPNWRPKSYVFDEVKDFRPTAIGTSNSITLSWSTDFKDFPIFFIYYQALNICENGPEDLKRLKSNGFLSTKYPEIMISDLIPFTKYKITISNVLFDEDVVIDAETKPSPIPTIDELPNKVHIQSTDTTAFISWDAIECRHRFGRIFYSLIVSNDYLNFSTSLLDKSDTSYEIKDLRPFTRYNLKLITSRELNAGKDIDNSALYFNFTTAPGVAPAVLNLEVYTIDENQASLRFELPKNPQGIPSTISVSKCNALSYKKCKTQSADLKKCRLWPDKYCFDVDYLIPQQLYNFKVNLRNRNAVAFGEEAFVKAYTVDRAPGKPENLTYRMDCTKETEYCHLNISWLHPYHQNGTIEAFYIYLNSSGSGKNNSESESIHEVLTIHNRTYMPKYTYQIKYVPYNTRYDLHVQSANAKYRSEFATVSVKTSEIGDHIDQKPKLIGRSDDQVMFHLPYLDRRLDHYQLVIVVQDFDRKVALSKELKANKKIVDNLCHNFGKSWISHNITIRNNDTKELIIGQSIDESSKNSLVSNQKLNPDTTYCATFIITNHYKNSDHDVVYYEKFTTESVKTAGIATASSSSHNYLYILLILLILVPVAFIAYRMWNKKQQRKLRQLRSNQKPENVYESLPFEEGDNFVINETYDNLMHK